MIRYLIGVAGLPGCGQEDFADCLAEVSGIGLPVFSLRQMTSEEVRQKIQANESRFAVITHIRNRADVELLRSLSEKTWLILVESSAEKSYRRVRDIKTHSGSGEWCLTLREFQELLRTVEPAFRIEVAERADGNVSNDGALDDLKAQAREIFQHIVFH